MASPGPVVSNHFSVLAGSPGGNPDLDGENQHLILQGSLLQASLGLMVAELLHTLITVSSCYEGNARNECGN